MKADIGIFLSQWRYLKKKLELMFMKHYAPNRCLYIKVAKLRTGMGSAEMSHLQNCSLKIYLKRALGGRVGGQVGCERRIKVFLFFVFFLGGGRVGRGVGLRGQGRCEQRSEVFVKIKKKNSGGGGGRFGGGGGVGLGGGSGWGGQGGCERRIEVFVKIQKKKTLERGVRGGVGFGGSGWM